MDIHQNQQRIKSIYQMLFEMATGNLAFRVQLKDQEDQFDELATMLNVVAEKMQVVMSQSQNANSYSNNSNVAIQPKSDAALIQHVYQYILKNLEDPLPSTKELSKMFGTNEFKLKDSFRNFFNTSIYQFYNDERLKKAHLLIQQTAIPLKEIAFICGFNDYTNFYKAFRKKFNCTPKDIKRNKNNNSEREE